MSNFPRDIKISTKIYVLVGLTLLLMASVIALGLRHTNAIAKEVTAAAEENIPLLEAVSRITFHSLYQSIHLERAIQFGKRMAQDNAAKENFEMERKNFFRHAQMIAREIEKNRTFLERMSKKYQTTHRRKNRVLQVDYALRSTGKERADYEFLAERVFNLLSQGKLPEAEPTIQKVSKVSKEEEQQFQSGEPLKSLTLAVEGFAEDSIIRSEENKQRAVIGMLLVSAFILLFSTGVGTFVSRSLTKPLRVAVNTARRIAAGDRNVEVEITSKDEIGQLLHAMKTMSFAVGQAEESLRQHASALEQSNTALQVEITERVKAEEQVWRQNEFLNSVLESLTHPFYVIDANDYTVKMANSALYPGKLSEKTACYTLTHKRDKPCNGSDHPCPLEEIKKTKRSVVTEHLHYDRDGNTRNVEVHAYPILDDKGNVSEVIEYTLDITERRRAEEALKSQTGLLNNVISNSPSFIFWKDKNSVYLGCNDNFAKLAGVKKPEDIIGKTDYDLSWKKEESDSYRKTDKEVMTKGAPILDIEEPAHQAGGKELTILTNKVPLKNATGEIFGVLGIFTDITAWKKIEQELTNLAKFPSENPNPVLRVQKDGKILYGNNAVLPLFAKWKTKAGGLIPAKWRRLVDKAFESEKTINSEEEIDGKIFSFVIAPVTDNDYANMYARDITERKKAEAQLKAAQEKLLETAHRAGMAQVAGDVLHNVGNVLTSVNVSTTVIREKVTSSELANLGKVASIINEHTDDLGTFLTEDPQGKHIPVYLTEVSKSLQDEQTDIISRLQVLTDNVRHIKDIVRMQQSYAKVSGVKVQTSLSELAEDAIQINSAGLERYGTRLIRQFDELGDVEIDKQKVLHVLVNLISNAKYALSGSNKEGKLLTIRIYKHSEDRFRIEVADNGVGISEDNHTKIFSHGFTTKKNGHGFGLHSSALASKEMGGSLTVHSDGVGQGATFTLELPFKPIGVMK